MIRISQLKLKLNHTNEDIKLAIKKAIKYNGKIISYKIVKKSIDAREKENIRFIYTIDVEIEKEDNILNKKIQNISKVNDVIYEFKITGEKKLTKRPVIIGTGPAGLFCGLMLAKSGFCPILLERGNDVKTRTDDVENYWKTGKLNINSNVQFGEGGAGTFSDGKLNTVIKDKFGRQKKILETFVKYGANEDILYLNKPHIGTDVLKNVVKNMREDIIKLGGEVRFKSCVTDFIINNGKIEEIVVNNKERLACEVVILAIGHSARDTFLNLSTKNIEMIRKPFAIGLRIEHPAEMINISQYGQNYNRECLPTADYKLTYQAKNGRNVYSFCMCPGGYVVNSSSEEKRIVVNGMSNYKRDAKNSNSAIIVNVNPDDFIGNDVLAGVKFQRHWEEMAYKLGGSNGNVPIQLFEDFSNNRVSKVLGDIEPSLRGNYILSSLNECLPSYVVEAIIEGINIFDSKIKGFKRPDSILSGVETRTSSPIRIVRNENFESNIKGIFPCGEGAGYAGGITSASIDGVKVAEEIARRYYS